MSVFKYGMSLNLAKGRAGMLHHRKTRHLMSLASMPPEKQSPQVRHVSPQNRKEFRVRATLTSRTLPGGENPDIRGMHGHPSQL